MSVCKKRKNKEQLTSNLIHTLHDLETNLSGLKIILIKYLRFLQTTAIDEEITES